MALLTINFFCYCKNFLCWNLINNFFRQEAKCYSCPHKPSFVVFLSGIPIVDKNLWAIFTTSRCVYICIIYILYPFVTFHIPGCIFWAVVMLLSPHLVPISLHLLRSHVLQDKCFWI